MKRNHRKKANSSLFAKAERALREAVAEAIEAHRRSGNPIAVWNRGKVVSVYPDRLMVREITAKNYGS